jgi:CCR4-NOT transcription complex subunit 1
LQTFGTAFYSIQPSVFEGFSFGWLTLITHRLFLPAMLQSQGRTTGGWDTLLRLFGALFKFFTLASAEGEGSGTLREFYPGICRLMLMLHRDYPEFLIENHAVLNAMVPERISQLHNLINSAATHAVVAEQPDPFERGLKINRLEQVRQAPPVHTDHERMLRETNILQPVERALNGSSDEISAVLAAFDHEDGQVDTLLINVLILHVGIRATANSTVFSATAPPAKFLGRLLTEARPEVRFHILCALTNQLRYVNGHTQYFSTALVHMFSVESDEIRQSLMNVFVNRLSMARPHPWGLLVTMLELIKNPAYDIWNFSWIKAHPQVENMLMTLVQHQERMPHNSPLRSVA